MNSLARFPKSRKQQCRLLVHRIDVRFGSLADICSANSHVRYAPESDRESRHPQPGMSALHPKADMCSALAHVRYGPIADISIRATSDEYSSARQDNPDLGELVRLCLDFD
jgi:hypothetical protein